MKLFLSVSNLFTKTPVSGGLAGISVTRAATPLLICAAAWLVGLSGTAFGQTAAATTTTLAVTSGGSTVTSVSAETVVTLTATVVAGTTPVTPGLVNFCDATATYCEDIHIVGSAQLTTTGTAVFKFRPGVGSHNYKAVFVGTKTYAGSSSAASALTVGAPSQFTSFTNLTASGSAGTYNLTATVGGAASAPPTGTISFVDTANSNAVVGTAALSAATSPGLLSAGSFAIQSGEEDAEVAAVGDFNGDGIPDIVITRPGLAQVMTGDGDGTFTPGALVFGIDYSDSIQQVIVGDFNGDGKLDIAIVYLDEYETGNAFDFYGYLAVFLGNGDGTFSNPIPLDIYNGSGRITSQFAIGDFNGDGIPDLVSVCTCASTATLMLGNGDGTFTVQAGPTIPSAPNSIAVGDFNGDGIQDFAVGSVSGGGVFLGNGDGTFTAGLALAYRISGIEVADFNGDGIPDLLAYYAENGSTVLLGQGNGSFTPGPTPSGLDANASLFLIGDFNGDGIPDVAGADGTQLSVYLGKGDGTFASEASSSAYMNKIDTVVSADFNGDGDPDFAVAGITGATSAPAVFLNLPQIAATPSTAVTLAPGNHTIDASYPGDSNYAASVSNSIAESYLVSPTLTLGASSGTAYPGQTVTLTATLAPYSVDGVGTNGEMVTFYYGTPQGQNGTLGTVTLTNGVATINWTVSQVGTYYFDAIYGGDGIFQSSTASTGVSVSLANPTLTLTAIPTNSAGQAVTMTATISGFDPASSVNGETITFCDLNSISSCEGSAGIGTGTITSGVATFSTSELTSGIHHLQAVYPGDFGDLAAGSNTVLVAVGRSGQAVPTVTLGVTSAGSPVTSVASGTPVTLTASVAASGALVAPGTVTFFDNTVEANISGQSPLGTAQLTSGGSASITVRLGIGAHSLQAYFTGTAVDGPSLSSASSLAVTGIRASATSWDETTLTLLVNGVEPPSDEVWPTGTVQILDQTDANAVFGTESLIGGGYDYGLAPLVSSATGSQPFAVASGDFNQDGIPDLAVANSGTSTVGVMLGNGDGTFQSQVTYTVGSGVYAVAVGDFNDDGKPDLVVANFSGNSISVLLGNGDGTFGTQQTYATGGGPDAVAVGDFNGDGILDLAVVNQTDNTVSILLGNGDGTFQAQQTYATGNGPDAVAVGDFNGDGNLDLAVANNHDGTASILLGNGDGTLQAQVAYATGAGPVSIAVADFNQDSKLDLAVANLSGNTVSVLSGNGDGTFQTQVTYATGIGPEQVIAANMTGNANGYQDLAVVNSGAQTITVLENENEYNKGFTPLTIGGKTATSVSGTPVSLVVADLNGDGLLDLAVLLSSSAKVQPLLNTSGYSSTSAAVALDAPGTHYYVGVYSGDSNFSPSTSSALEFEYTNSPTTLTLTSSPNPSNYGDAVTISATLSPSTGVDVSSDGYPVTFFYGGTVLGTGTLSGGVASISVSSLPVGADALKATFARENGFQASESSTISQTVRPAPLTVTGESISRPYGMANPTLAATVTGAVNGDTFTTSATTTATAASAPSAYPVVPQATGTHIADYSVNTVNGTLTVTQATPTIALTASASSAFVSTSITFTATLKASGSGAAPSGSVSFYDGSTMLGSGTLGSGTATYSTSALPTGSDSITAVYAGDTNYATATSIAVSEAILETFTLGPASGGSSSATASAGGSATYSLVVTPPSGTTLTDAVTFTVAGMPSGATGTFSPSTVAAGAGATNVTLTVNLPASASALPQPSPFHRAWPVALVLILLPFAGGLRRRSRSWSRMVGLAALAAAGATAVAGLAGCGGSSGGTTPPPPQTYSLTVTATSGSLSNTATLTLTVN